MFTCWPRKRNGGWPSVSGMTEAQDPGMSSLADVAGERPEETVDVERDVVGDQPDTGDTVPTDDAQ